MNKICDILIYGQDIWNKGDSNVINAINQK